jgi:hypothetical protein
MTCPQLIDCLANSRNFRGVSRQVIAAWTYFDSPFVVRADHSPHRARRVASLVPDPDHPDCPAEFRDAVNRLLNDRVENSSIVL